MKVRNRKTGKIGNLVSTNWDEVVLKVLDDNGVQLGKYTSLAGLNKEWEDCEEPVGYWYVSEQGIPGRINFSWDSKESIENHKEIGNYFETYVEAEKAVEKLKALKRLKEAGLKVTEFNYNLDEKYSGLANAIDGKICFKLVCYKDFDEDLDLLFGGEQLKGGENESERIL